MPLQQKPTAFQPVSLPPIVTEQIFIYFPVLSLNTSHVFFIRIFLHIDYGQKHHFLILCRPPPPLNCSAQIPFHLSFQRDTHILVSSGNFPHHYFHFTKYIRLQSIKFGLELSHHLKSSMNLWAIKNDWNNIYWEVVFSQKVLFKNIKKVKVVQSETEGMAQSLSGFPHLENDSNNAVLLWGWNEINPHPFNEHRVTA